jgi:hypothetical protein
MRSDKIKRGGGNDKKITCARTSFAQKNRLLFLILFRILRPERQKFK